MRVRAPGILAWTLCSVALGLGAIGAWLGAGVAAERPDLLLTVAVLGTSSLTYPLVGAYLASRLPRNATGWLLCGAGLLLAILSSSAAAARTGTADAGAASSVALAAWLASWTFVPALVLAGVLLPIVFPTGRPPGAAWGWMGVIAAGLGALVAVGYALRPGPLAAEPGIDNPLGVPAGAELLALLAGAGDLLFPVAVGLATASLIARYRTADPIERQQIKWFAYAATLMAAGFAVATLPWQPAQLLGWAVGAAAVAALPAVVAAAVLRQGLYAIDVLINRTLVYFALIGLLGGLYTASIALFQRIFVSTTGDRSDAAIVLTALILAGLFTPARKVLEGAVDRRFKPMRAARPPSEPDASLGPIERRLAGVEARLEALERGGAAGGGPGTRPGG